MRMARHSAWTAGWLAIFAIIPVATTAQTNANERGFPQSKATIEQTLKTMQANLSGRLPVLEGFARSGEHPLDRYQRGFYQATVTVTSSAGGSLVRVTTKVTAWYSDPVTSRSGYRLLTSNGRIEADLLDQLAEQLTQNFPPSSVPASAQATDHPAQPELSAPQAKFPETNPTFSSSLTQGLSSSAKSPEKTREEGASGKRESGMQAQIASLQEILKNTAHPKNLVAVKTSGTPVVATPSLNAKPEFLASMHDEFELLDFNADWVHVRISGLSRGWIWRNSVEMPEGIPDTEVRATGGLTPAADLFRVTHEQVASFPGDWPPLRNKSVKIISVQKTEDGAKDAGAKERLEYAKFLFQQNYAELAKAPQDPAGIVLIFDSSDGGMIAATMNSLEQWKAGTLSDAALWRQCFFDPPEIFDSAESSGSK